MKQSKWIREEKREDGMNGTIITVRCPFCGKECEVVEDIPGDFVNSPLLVITEKCEHMKNEWDWASDNEYEFLFEIGEDDEDE